MPVFYLDTSALVKLVLDEPETPALRAYLRHAELLSCELALTELPRAIRRAVATDVALPLAQLLARSGELLDAVALLPLERPLLLAAGAIEEPLLRALDAVHVAAAIDVMPIDGFISYDERQSAGARLAGLRTVAPSG